MDNKPTNKQRAAEEEISGASGSGASSTKFLTDIADAERLGDVTQAMILAGAAGNSRIAAGLRTWAKARSRRGFKGPGATFVGKALRFTGHTQTAMWIDRFFAKPVQKERKARSVRGIGGQIPSAGGWAGGGVSPVMKGELKIINTKITVLGDAITNMAEDVSDIKSLLMPKDLSVKGRRVKKPFGGDATQRMKMLYGGGLEGDELERQSGPEQTVSIRYDPLAPPGEQFRVVTSKGKLTSKKPNEGFMDNALKKAALATAKLAFKIQKKGEEKSALKKKRTLVDPKETDPLVADDPVTLLRVDMNKRFDELFKLLGDGGIGGIGGKKGLLSTLLDSPIMKLLGKAGLVGLAGFIGYQVGDWLNNTFKLDQKINDGIDKVMGWFGKGNQAAVEAATKTDEFNKILAETNKKLIGSGWSMVGQGKYANNVTNTIFTDEELPDDVKAEFGKRKLAGFTGQFTAPPAKAAPPAEAAPPAAVPSAPAPAPTPTGGETGTLTTKPKGDLPMPGDAIKDYILAASKRVGVDAGIMMAVAKQESSFNPSAVPINKKTGKLLSSAKGLYQFINSTWDNMVQKYGDMYPELHKGPMDPLASAIAGALFIKENADFLKKRGLPVNGTSIYAAHFLGAGGAAKLFNSDPNAIAAQIMPAAAKSNPHIFYKNGREKTIAEVQDTLFQKVGKYANQYAAVLGTQGTQTPYSTTPSPTVPASVVDIQSRELVAANMPAASSPTVIPVSVDNSTRTNTMRRQPAPSASSISQDPSFIRATGRDALHPVLV